MRNYTTQLLKDITDKMDLISGEEEIDYFSYLRGSDITEGMHCGGYKEAIANALSAANAFEHEIRKDAEDAKAKLTAIFLEAERADMQCYMTLREVSETLKDWMLLARKLRLSMTGGGGYGEQLFCENNIKQWTGETAARLEKESYSAEERAEDRNEAFLAGQYTGGMPSEIKEEQRLNEREQTENVLQEQITEKLMDRINSLELSNDDVNLFWEIYDNTSMTDEQERVVLQLATCLGVPYSQTSIPDEPPYTYLDCSALVFTGFRDAHLNPEVLLPRKSTRQTEQGVLIYDAQKDEELDFSMLLPGDIIGYDLHIDNEDGTRVSGHDDVVDHVGVFIGYDDNGLPKVIDASSLGVSIRSIYVGRDKSNIERIVRVIE